MYQLFAVALTCVLVGCGGSSGATVEADEGTSDQVQTTETEQVATEDEAAEDETADVDENDPRNQPGQTFDIPFVDAAKLEALGLHQATFTEERYNTPEESFDTLNIWACHDIPAGETTSEYDESGCYDFIDSEEGFFGDYAYHTTIPVGDDEIDLAYHFNYDSSYTDGDATDDDGLSDVVSYLESTDHEYQRAGEDDSPIVLASQPDPMRDDGSVYLRSYRIFRITDDTTVVVAIASNHVLPGSAESAEAIAAFEALSDAFGMASPYTAG
jgi:hypothetical protein